MEIVYYVAASLDGYIATAEGGVDWLDPFGAGEDHGAADFYTSIDSIVMGSGTYAFALGHTPWMAPDRPSWVFTRRTLELAHPNVTLTDDDPPTVAETLQARGLARAWLLGGGKLATSFREHDLITEYIVSVIPVVLGGGIPLFAAGGELESLQLQESRSFASGIVQSRYLSARGGTR